MRIMIVLALLAAQLAGAAVARAKTINVEFKFTPYTGDTSADHVETVPGTATVYLNGIVVATQPIVKDEVPVLFDAREVGPAVWVPAASFAELLRKGRNTIRVEFAPSAAAPYTAELRWAEVTDQVFEDERPGGGRATNQANEGVARKKGSGALTMKREFQADFAVERPWHAYPPVTSLTDEDREKILAVAAERAAWFAPDFAGIYRALEGNEHIQVAQLRAARCLDQVYRAGLRVGPPKPGTYDVVTTGGPAVVVQPKGEMLYDVDRAALAKVKDEDVQMCAGIALATVYQPRLVVVRAPDGTWQALP
ncbi:MAG: hypothetical protein KIT14_16900 [bacterium]|nr:hypothetical protein [bacterium]